MNERMGEEIKIKVANWYAVGHKQDLLLKSYCEDLEKRAGGKLKVKYYPARYARIHRGSNMMR